MKLFNILIAITVIAVVLFFAAYGLGLIGGDEIRSVHNEDFSEFYYSGDLRNGRFTGHGVINFTDGSYYYGNFTAGRFDGEGTYSSKNGFSFSGKFIDNQIFVGSFIYPRTEIKYAWGKVDDDFSGEGWAYSGFLGNEGQSGYGVFTYNNGTIYRGNFTNGLADGEGRLSLTRGELIYKGNFKAGLFDGYGLFVSPDGWSYEGGFKNGLFDGAGFLTIGDDIIHGVWSEGLQVVRYAD